HYRGTHTRRTRTDGRRAPPRDPPRTDPLAECIERRIEVLADALDVLSQLLRDFSHCTSSFKVSAVSCGTGSNSRNRRRPCSAIAAATTARTAPTAKNAQPVGMTAVSAHAAANDSITTARYPASPAMPKRLPAAPARCNSSLVSALASSSSLRTSAWSSLVTSPSSCPTDRSSSTLVAIGTPRPGCAASQEPTSHEPGGRAAQQERPRAAARKALHV